MSGFLQLLEDEWGIHCFCDIRPTDFCPVHGGHLDEAVEQAKRVRSREEQQELLVAQKKLEKIRNLVEDAEIELAYLEKRLDAADEEQGS